MYKLNAFRERIYKRGLAARISTAKISVNDFMFGSIKYNKGEGFENRYYGLRQAVSSVVFDKLPRESFDVLINSCDLEEWLPLMVLVDGNGCYLMGVNLVE